MKKVIRSYKNALEVRKLNAYAGKSQILFNLNFSLPKGKICAFIGHNGAGKTTTIKSILTLRPKSSGKITINNVDGNNIMSRQNVGYIPEKGSIEPISAKNFLRAIGSFYKLSKKHTDEKAKKLIDFFHLPANRLNVKLNKLSSGQNKVITIVQAFLGNPYLIIADEPTDNLDPETRDLFWDFVAKFHSEHKHVTFFIITHNLDEIEKYTDYMVILDHGLARFEGKYDRSPGLRAKYRKMRDT
jgi:ABC-type multidrug transport system ATPase subunit